jgi:ABC-type sugar transport system permease subunit
MVALAAMVLVMMPAPATATASWGCENYWAGPSSANSVEECLRNQNRDSQWTKWMWIPALPALVFVIVFMIYPIVFALRQCCNLCGGRRRQPGVCCRCSSEWDLKSETEKNQAYTPADHCCVKCPAFFLCILSVGVIVVIVRGASEADKANSYLLEDIQGISIDTFKKLNIQVQTALTNTSNTSTTVAYYAPATASTFQPMTDMVRYYQDGYNNYVSNYESIVTNVIRIGMNCLGAIPFVFFILLPIYASKNNCRHFWPSCTTCIYFLFAIVFSLLGVIFLAMAVGFATGCGEVERQTLREPGIFQWYVKPYCESQQFFNSMVAGFDTSEASYASKFCEALTANCSSTTTYNSASPNDNFYCTVTSANYNTVCTNFASAKAVVDQMKVKTGSPACTSCMFSACETTCNTVAQRGTAKRTMYLYAATRGYSSAANITLPLKGCNYLLDIGADTVTRGCPALRDASWMIGFGCFFAGLLFSVGIIVLFRGQKVFYKLLEQDKMVGGGIVADSSDDEREMEHQPANRV